MGRLLCRLDELPEAGSRGFDPFAKGHDTLFAVRKGGQVFVWRNACPHVDGAPMAWRKDAYLSADGRHIVCHAHGARFDISTGQCVLGPCEGQFLTPVPFIHCPSGEIRLAPQEFQETRS